MLVPVTAALRRQTSSIAVSTDDVCEDLSFVAMPSTF